MELPKQSVTFTPEQVGELNRKLANARHNINNHLALIVSAAEVLRRKPELVPRMTDTQTEQTKRIEEELSKFSAEFERGFCGGAAV